MKLCAIRSRTDISRWGNMNLGWKKSSFCESGACAEVAVVAGCAGGECVEVLHAPDVIQVRNSTAPDVVVTFTRAEWDVFLRGARAGEFDL